MLIEEQELGAAIRGGRLEKLYFLYGKECYLTKLYTDRIVEKAVGKEPLDFNLIKINGNPDPTFLGDSIEGVPVFSDKKAIVINDLNPEKLDADTLGKYTEIFSDIPDEVVVVINITGFELDAKKTKTKKLIAAIDKVGAVAEFQQMTPVKIAELVIKNAARNGVVISRENARYLAQLTLCNITLVGSELKKLCSYVGNGGTITSEVIDKMCAKQLDTSIYTLATAITAGKRAEAFKILDELFDENIQSVVILSALAGTFIDFYRAKIGKAAGAGQNNIVEDFSYQRNRAWVIGKAITAVSRTDISYLRNCVKLLSEADIKLKSSPVDDKIIIEQTMVKLMVTK